jgi:hypothetical protein
MMSETDGGHKWAPQVEIHDADESKLRSCRELGHQA